MEAFLLKLVATPLRVGAATGILPGTVSQAAFAVTCASTALRAGRPMSLAAQGASLAVIRRFRFAV